MAIVFNADEIFGMAETIERNGAAFYRAAAGNNPEARKLLLDIAEQEDKHLEIFQAMRATIDAAGREETAYDPDGQAELYIKAMADRRVFNVDEDPVSTLSGKETIGEILGIAIGKEKDSIVFYSAMKASVPPALGRDKLDGIIAEEFRHIAWLRDAFETCGVS